MNTLRAITAILLTAGPLVLAQNQAITNADVVNMVKSGLSEELIVSAIRSAPKAAFDTSPAALMSLKGSKVTDRIITAMLNAGRVVPPATPVTPVSEQVIMPDGAEVRLRLLNAVSSGTAQVDEKVRFEVVDDVAVDGKVVIARGAQAAGTVTEAQSKKSFGRRGHLNFTIDYVKAVDGQNVRLRTSKKVEGDESYVKAGVVTYLTGPFGALVKGKDVEVAAGTEYTIFIDGERRISLKAPPASR